MSQPVTVESYAPWEPPQSEQVVRDEIKRAHDKATRVLLALGVALTATALLLDASIAVVAVCAVTAALVLVAQRVFHNPNHKVAFFNRLKIDQLTENEIDWLCEDRYFQLLGPQEKAALAKRFLQWCLEENIEVTNLHNDPVSKKLELSQDQLTRQLLPKMTATELLQCKDLSPAVKQELFAEKIKNYKTLNACGKILFQFDDPFIYSNETMKQLMLEYALKNFREILIPQTPFQQVVQQRMGLKPELCVIYAHQYEEQEATHHHRLEQLNEHKDNYEEQLARNRYTVTHSHEEEVVAACNVQIELLTDQCKLLNNQTEEAKVELRTLQTSILEACCLPR